MKFKNHLSFPKDPTRVVVVGSRGFIGKAVVTHLNERGIPVCPVPLSDIDLTEVGSDERLGNILRSDDAVVFNSALISEKSRAPEDFMASVLMGWHACKALKKAPVAHVVYISSDTVYPFDINPICEDSYTAPEDIYGAMHLSRELMFRKMVASPLAILRLNAVYGIEDSHDAYGPNRFLRTAVADGKIGLFGEGVETREHLTIEDVAAVIGLCLSHRSSGVLNVASGESFSFRKVAEIISSMCNPPVDIENLPQRMPVKHRSYDVSAFAKAFPDFHFTPLAEGLARVRRQMIERG